MLRPATAEAYQLLHDGTLALARCESNGIKINAEYLERTTAQVARRIQKLEQRLQQDEVWVLWKKRFRERTKLGSLEQLAQVLFEDLGFKHSGYTRGAATGGKKRYRADEETISKVNHLFVRRYMKLGKLKKLHGTYLKGVQREAVDGFLHPFFNLNLVKTFRSSSDSPNFQNIPVRDPEQGDLIRGAFIPREGNCWVSADFKQLEVAISCTYHEDPVLIDYVSDPRKDMHRDTASELFFLNPKDVDKMARYVAKNGFVFAEFYGSYYVDVANHLWSMITEHKLTGPKGEPLREYLATQGIKGPGKFDPSEKPKQGTFERHVMDVEHDFWNKRFRVYAAWKKTWYEKYLKTGRFRHKTGFVEEGLYSRNDTINHGTQGAAFHCLLWTLIRTQQKLDLRKMETLLIGQIHDSMEADSPENELQRYIKMVNKIVSVELPAHWKWINVPLRIEFEVTPPGGSWKDKKPWVEVDGVWQPEKEDSK